MMRVAELYGPVAEDVEQAARIFSDELISDQALISDLCRHVGQFHGKMVRPALLLLTGRACGGVQPAHHVLAAVVEMVHIATLVHDDVLDEADIRRRAATVNRLWGNERAVLMGDFLISHAYHLCSSLDSQYAARLIAQTTNTVCEGEMMQVANRDNYELTEDEYLDIITRKTGELIGTCCLLGAKFAGADDVTVSRMRQFGLSLGIAFQIIDDLLDLTGDEAEAGKSLGRDVCTGKLTLPLIHYVRESTPARRSQMLAFLRGDGRLRCRHIATLLEGSESLDYSQQMAYSYVNTALEIASALPPSEARDSLCAMAEFVLARRY